MIYALYFVLALPFLVLFAAYFYSRLVVNHGMTTAEALIRWAFLLARWTLSAAEGMDAGLIAYRSRMHIQSINSGAEDFRPWREAA